MYEYSACLMQRSNGRDPIYDGDTVWLKVRKSFTKTIDFGFHIHFDVSLTLNYGLKACRLHGIDTPEVNRRDSREAGIAARDFVREKLEPLEWFKIETFKDHERGKYGRYLVRIYLPDGSCLNDVLIATGHAVAKNY